MRTSSIPASLLAGLSLSLALSACHSSAQPTQPNQQSTASQVSWSAVDQALGREGKTQPDGVRRYSFPRSDLSVQLDGVQVKPALALGSWLAFQPAGPKTMVMGDLVLTADEVNPVMSALLNGGLRVTALHNHLLKASPETFYMHVWGQGDPAKLAAALHSALALSHTPLAAPATPPPPAALDLDTAALDRTFGAQGKANGGVYQYGFPRAEKITEDGMNEGASMGTATSVNLQPLGGGKAAATGDFVLLASEVDPVMRALRSSGIEVTALHTHMLGEQPTIYFMHFWGVGPAGQLATGLRAAIDRTNVKR